MSGLHQSSPNKTAGIGDWRKLRPGQTPKLSYILEKKEFTDVSFRVGNPSNSSNTEVIPAHRLVLSMYSSVFEAMFQGPLSAGSEEVIVIPDIEPRPFHVFLKFIYTGQFEKELSAEEALSVLYAAKKYDVTDLEFVCMDFLKNLVNHSTAITIFQTARLLDVNDLVDETYAFIARHFDELCGTEDFLNLTLENLTNFLRDDDTRGFELDFFWGVLRWAESECLKQNLDPSPFNRRTVAKLAFESLRYSIIPCEDFALEVVQSGVLTPEESTLIFQHMVVPNENRHVLPPLPFNTKKRNCSIYVANFYEGMAKTAYVDISAGWYNKFTVDQPITVVSFGFYGPFSAELASYQVSIKLLKDSNEEILGELNDETVVAKMKEIFHVKFHKPVVIFPGSTYRAWFSIKGPLTCHGVFNAGHEVFIPVNYKKFDKIKFTYNITGAHQLPEIAFQI